ncbi:hypothetical protein [Sphingomonas bacterium]|uniref:hypothetical protein n=1 Tax=Sphingomonas bacterium TaxID=1895847 RepID=UPI001575FB0B|nr:hypothetical protein [Sphingomonas bacterium]
MKARMMIAVAALSTIATAGCSRPGSDVGANIAASHDNAADAIDNRADVLDNRADAMRNEAKQTRDWGKDLKKEADTIAKHGGHPDQATLNQM